MTVYLAFIIFVINAQGIPESNRGEIWMIYSGAVNEMESHKGYYKSVLVKCMGKCNIATDEIGKENL